MAVQQDERRQVSLDFEMIDALRASGRGSVLLPGETDYEAARAIWNGMIDKRPAVIVRPAGAADIIAAVSFAREHGLLLAIKGGGHNVAGNALCDDGLLIDMSSTRGVRVDPKARTAYVEGGALCGDFDHETAAFKLASTGGIVSTTGVAGLTFGGGIGWLNPRFGAAWDDPGDQARCIKWAHGFHDALAPHAASGRNLNFTVVEASERIDRIRASYGENYDRLVRVENRYDPTNFFRVNNNIRPSV